MAQTIIRVAKGRDRAALIRDLRAAGLKVKPCGALARFLIVDGVSPEDFPLRQHPSIEKIGDGDAPAQTANVQTISIDASLRDGSWALPRIISRDPPWNRDWLVHPIEASFQCARTGIGVDIYVIDTGINTQHIEFGGRATNVYEAVSSGGAGDDNGHGTLCASAAAGATCGIARDALIWSFKWAGSNANGSDASIIACFGQALSHYQGRSGTGRPAVISASISSASTLVGDAASDCIDAGMVVIASVGNEGRLLGTGVIRYPAQETDVVACGGIVMNDTPYFATSDATNYGSLVDILSPGQNVRLAAGTARGLGANAYETRRGTSISAPLCAGVVACMLQGHARLNTRAKVQAVKTKLLANATTGRFRSAFGLSPLPDRILYLDPAQSAPEPISGL